jgi:hypothetical protein
VAGEKILVLFDGLELIWLKGDDGCGPLAPLHHLDEGGHVTFEAAFGTESSYAHIFEDRSIRRHGRIIGTVDDLEFLPQPHQRSSSR